MSSTLPKEGCFIQPLPHKTFLRAQHWDAWAQVCHRCHIVDVSEICDRRFLSLSHTGLSHKFVAQVCHTCLLQKCVAQVCCTSLLHNCVAQVCCTSLSHKFVQNSWSEISGPESHCSRAFLVSAVSMVAFFLSLAQCLMIVYSSGQLFPSID